MNEEKRDAPDVIMLPPMLFVIFVCAGAAIGWAIPIEFSRTWGWAGLILLSLAFLIDEWALRLFKNAETNVAPNQPANTIVSDGPFKYSRNPMYVSFLLLYAGISFLTGKAGMLLLILPLFYMLDQKVIKPEEKYLTQKFGDTYLDYKAKVRRWI